VGPERPAVDKLLAEEVLVPNVKAAEDLNLRPLSTASAAQKPHTLSICQTPLGLSASRPVESPGCNQHRSVPLTPRRSCKKPIIFL
jgi:hypothetical protein